MPKIIEFGYANRGSEGLLRSLMDDQKTLLIDVRRTPYCEWSTAWQQDTLKSLYSDRYKFAGAYLGNKNYKNRKPIELMNEKVGIPGLLRYIDEGYTVVVMCGCKGYKDSEGEWVCHRAAICDKVLERRPNVQVEHPHYGGMKRDWTPQEGLIPCISIAQPFASAIALGRKNIEIRTWWTSYTGLIALHAGLTWYGGVKLPGCVSEEKMIPIQKAVKRLSLPTTIAEYPIGSIVALAYLKECVKFTEESYKRLQPLHGSDAPYTSGEYGWLFENVCKLDEPIHVQGTLGLFGVNVEPLQGYIEKVINDGILKKSQL